MQNSPVLPICINYPDTRLGFMRKHSVTLRVWVRFPVQSTANCFLGPLTLVITVLLFLLRLQSFLSFGLVSSLQLPFSQRAFFLFVTSNSLWNVNLVHRGSIPRFSLCFPKSTLSLLLICGYDSGLPR